MVERALRRARHRPMLMVDLAVPRDIEAEVGELDDVFLYTRGRSGQIVQEGLDARQGAVAQAEAIIDAQVDDFMHWLGNREAGADHPRAARPGRAHAPPRSRARAAPARARAKTRSRCSKR